MRKVSLWDCLPPFLKRFRELDALLEAEEPEFQGLAERSEALAEDLFIQTATEGGLTRYERLLGIRPDDGAELADRRTAILTRWYDAAAFTMRTLKERIAAVQGNDDVAVWMDEDEPYRIHISTHMQTQEQLESLNYIVATMLPANLAADLGSTTILTAEIDGRALAAGGVTMMVEAGD